MRTMDHDVHAFPRLQRLGVAGAVGALAVTLALAIGSGSAIAAPKITVLGAAAPTPASCPNNCLVEARVTGYQASIGAQKNPFMVRVPGKVVAWSIKLGAPIAKDTSFFNGEFGKSQGRLSVLKPVKKKKGKFTLVRQSPIEDLEPFFGTTTTFTLQVPLKVGRRHVVALTIPTWAPAFGVTGQPKAFRWRASRKATKKRGGCANRQGQANLLAGGPHEALGTQRRYGCAYKGARLLYSATVVARPGAKAK